MEETAIPLHSWFWLVVPMSVVFLLSIVNFLRHRTSANPVESIENRKNSEDQNDLRSRPAEGIPERDRP